MLKIIPLNLPLSTLMTINGRSEVISVTGLILAKFQLQMTALINYQITLLCISTS